jgi:mono/diheme cytochrome c family protein
LNRIPARAFFPAALLLLSAEGAAPQDPAPSGYDAVRPLLGKYCLDCHGPKKTKAKLDFTKFPDESSILRERRLWKRVLDQVAGHEMPPDDAPAKPSPAERERIAAYVEGIIERLAPGEARNPGRVVLRRLNRVEYRRTVRDLLGVDFDPSEDFPSDDVGYGFDNIGDVLSLPPLLMEKLVAAAEKIVARVVQVPEDFRPRTTHLEAEAMKGPPGVQPEGDGLVYFAEGEAGETVEVPREGAYLLRVRAGADQAGGEPARVSLRVDGVQAAAFDVPVSRRDPKVYEEKVTVKAGRRRLSAAFVNDYYNPEAPRSRNRDRNLFVDYLELHGPVDGKLPEPPESHRRLFVAAPSKGVPRRQAAREVLAAFLPRAFRRPLRPGELDRFLVLHDVAEKQGDSFEASLRVPLAAALVSPHFLYRVERDRDGADPGGVHRVDGFALASRLSYFLWSSMPDEALFDAARSGRLDTSAGVAAEVRRMLRDPRARSLAENFAVQWLQLRRLETHAPDPKRFPSFDEKLRKAMLEEAVELFHEIVREDRPVTELVTAGWTYLNDRLASHYGIPGVEGEAMRRVSLPDARRGGVLMLGAVLTVTSNPTRTSPVRRGKWVMETVLGTPPPPPLPDAGELKDETEEDRKLSLRVRTEKHRADPNCAACHRRMDPLGFGFENYDGVGAWREKDGAVPVDSAAELPDGRRFAGPVELKGILAARRDDFVRTLVEKTLTYALGRGVEYYDGPAVKEIRKALADKEFRYSALAAGVATSWPFAHRRNKAGEVKDE